MNTNLLERFKRVLFIDYETRSTADLGNDGAHKYNMDRSTEMIICAYRFVGEPKTRCSIFEIPENVREAIEDNNVLKVAHNAEFDMCVSKYVLKLDINYRDWIDTAYMCAYYQLPRALKNVAKYLKTKQKGSQEELMLFSFPIQKEQLTCDDELFFHPKYTKYNQPESHPKEWEAFIQYAIDDVDVMIEVYNMLPPLPNIEIVAMWLTFEMNFNGVPFDTDLGRRIYDMSEEYARSAQEKAKEIYGIDNLKSVPQVKKALLKEGIYLDSLNQKARLGTSHPILELRDQATGAAFSKIPKAFQRLCPTGRLHGEFKGYGTHTGRWSSVGAQMQNWARILSKVCEDLKDVKSYQHLRQHLRLCLGYTLDHTFECADLSQIEARYASWLACSKWRMETFANGGDIYARSAEKMFGIPHVSKEDAARQDGKCSELGFTYGGGKMAIFNINAGFFTEKGEDYIQMLVDKWRTANPEICELWRKLEKAFRAAIRDGACKIRLATNAIFTFEFKGKTMKLTMPSGRSLYYRGVSLVQTSRGSDLYYLDYSNNVEHPKRVKFWGGTILENITQAGARDVLVEIAWRILKREPRLKLIGNVHDELWYLKLKKYLAVDGLAILLEEMKRPIEWAEGLITCGDGFTSDRYRK